MRKDWIIPTKSDCVKIFTRCAWADNFYGHMLSRNDKFVACLVNRLCLHQIRMCTVLEFDTTPFFDFSAFALNHWVSLMGFPASIVCDRGTHSQGPQWSSLCSTYSIRMITAPTGSRYQVGTAERQVEHIKRTYRKVSATTELFSKHEKLAMVCAARNITPSSTSLWSPLFLVTGRSDHVVGLLNACEPHATAGSKATDTLIWERMKLLQEIRGSLLKMDAKLVLDISQRKRLRCVHNESLRRNDPAVAWLPDAKKWQSGFRFVSDSGRNMVSEKRK